MHLQVSELFSDHMVLRHSRQNPIWGTAPAGALIEVQLGKTSSFCTAASSGQWMVWIDTPGAGVVTSMQIHCGTDEIHFVDVACGEVWLAAGQSNMELPLMCIEGGAFWADQASQENVRLKSISRRCRDEQQAGWHFYPTESPDEPWKLVDRKSAAHFSAIGYVFGALLSRRLNMPVGLIECNWGGTMIQSWMPVTHLLDCPDTRKDWEKYQAVRASMGEGQAHQYLEDYQRTVRQALINDPDYLEGNLRDPLHFLEQDRNIAFIPLGGLGDPQEPGSLYEHMVCRAAPYGLSGVLWYQGEANGMRDEAHRYAGLFGRMLALWRKAWHDPALPFLTCQIAPFQTSLYWGERADWPELRAQQQLCTELYSHVSMAILLDAGMQYNIHPLNKQTPAERLYRLALEDVYGIPSQAHAAHPLYCVLHDNCLIIRFSKPIELRNGLVPAVLSSEGECIVSVKQNSSCELQLQLPDAGNVLGASYAQNDWLTPGLYDANGLPVAPFRLLL